MFGLGLCVHLYLYYVIPFLLYNRTTVYFEKYDATTITQDQKERRNMHCNSDLLLHFLLTWLLVKSVPLRFDGSFEARDVACFFMGFVCWYVELTFGHMLYERNHVRSKIVLGTLFCIATLLFTDVHVAVLQCTWIVWALLFGIAIHT